MVTLELRACPSAVLLVCRSLKDGGFPAGGTRWGDVSCCNKPITSVASVLLWPHHSQEPQGPLAQKGHMPASLFPVSRTSCGTWTPNGSALGSPARSHHRQLTPQEDRDRGMWTWAQIRFKDLAPAIVGAGKSEIHRAGRQAGASGRSPGCSREAEFLLREGCSLSADWRRLSHTVQESLCSESAGCRCC